MSIQVAEITRGKKVVLKLHINLKCSILKENTELQIETLQSSRSVST